MERQQSSESPVSEYGIWPSLLFFLPASAWGGLIYYLSSELAESRLWFAMLAVLLVGTPIALAGIYSATIRQIRRLEIFSRKGLLFRLLSGRPLKVIVWLCWAFFTGFFMLLQFQFYSAMEWSILFLVIPVFWLVFHLCRRLMLGELRPYLLTSMALTWARWLTPLLMILLYLTLVPVLGEPVSFDTVQEAVESSRGQLAGPGGSQLISEASAYLAFYEGLRAFALGRLGSLDAMSALVMTVLGSFIVYFNACAMLSCFLIPGREYRRVFGPLSNSDSPGPLTMSRLGMTVAITTFLTLFIYLPVFAYLEAWVQQRPEISRQAEEVQAQIITRLERIDDDYFREGTLAELDQARIDALRDVDVSLERFERQVEQAFMQLEGNVDIYLDWYYSLVGEYGRIANLLVGDLETYMVRKLEESLMQGDAFGEVQAAFNTALAEHEEAQRIYRADAQDIMAGNRIEPGSDEVVLVSRQAALADVLSPPVHQDMISLEQRMLVSSGGGAVAGVVSAVIIQKVVAKVVSKNTFKLAAKTMSKLIAGKVAGSGAGAGAGAAAGAALGSVVPGIGTAIGAVIGGFVGGVAVGVTVDKMLIEIEEAVNREQFRAEIMAAIDEARAEFMASIR